MNEEYVWRFASALLCLLCRTEGGHLGVTRFVTCKLLLFVVPLFAAVMWEGNSDPPCMSARVSVRISMGGSWDTSHHCLPPLFSFSLSQKKKRNQTGLNKHKEKSMTMTAVLLFFYRDKQMALYTLELQMINSFHVTQNKIIGLDGC